MGVVRREGDWRLEKRADGVYEITYDQEPQERILTPEHSSRQFGSQFGGMVSTREVDSYAEAEGLFEERASGNRVPDGMGLGGAGSSLGFSTRDDVSSGDGAWDSDEDNPVPPGGIALALVLFGGTIFWANGIDVTMPILLLGIGSILGGVSIFGWAFYKADSAWEAVVNLATVEEGNSSTGGTDGGEKTPPAPKSLKDDLYFDRANQTCEWCEEHTDQPEVHHIEPRSEGGPNDRDNLIVLCPNHHRQADAGAISKSKLRSKVRRIENQ